MEIALTKDGEEEPHPSESEKEEALELEKTKERRHPKSRSETLLLYNEGALYTQSGLPQEIQFDRLFENYSVRFQINQKLYNCIGLRMIEVNQSEYLHALYSFDYQG